MGKKKTSRAPAAPAGFTADQLRRATEARDAAAKGTPRVVLDALVGQPITIGEVTIPIIMLGHVLLLQKIGSPLAIEGGPSPTNEQVAEALFVLNRPAAQVLTLWAQGRAAWDAEVFTFATTKVPLSEMPAIGLALGRQIAAASSTIIGASSSDSSRSSSGEGAAGDHVSKKNVTTPAATSGTPSPTPQPNPTG